MFDNETLQGFFIEKLTDPKVDMHSWMATKMYSIIYNDPDWKCIKGVHNTERQNAKIGGFSIVYGASGKAIADMLGVSIEEGEDFIINYFKSLPGLKEKYDEAKKLALKRGWVEIDSLTHKRYFFKDFDKMNSLREKAIAFYPDGYRFLSDEEKAQFKSWLYEEHPEVKACWKEWGMLKGKLERRSINFRRRMRA